MASTLITGVGELVTNDPHSATARRSACCRRRRARGRTGRPGRLGRVRDARPPRPTTASTSAGRVLRAGLRRHPHPPGLRRRPLGGVRGPHGRPALRRRRHRLDGRARPAPRRTTSWAGCSSRRLAELRAQGTTTVEIKSGYGLTVDDEHARARVRPRAHARDDVPRRPRRPARRRSATSTSTRSPDRCSPPARRTPGGSTCSASRPARTPSTPTRPGPSCGPARAAGLGLRVHGNQLAPGPGVRLAVELGAASVDHCTYLTDADVDALAARRHRRHPAAGRRSSRPARRTPTPGGCSPPASRSRWPPTATPARATPRRCRS